MLRSHKDLDVWKKSIDFVTKIYSLTKGFPKEEMYGMIGQLRPASVSIPSNIAEGSDRREKQEFKQFLYIALANASEIDTQLIISLNLQYIDEANYEKLNSELETISKMLQGLIKSIENK